jgi:hypothetical protein
MPSLTSLTLTSFFFLYQLLFFLNICLICCGVTALISFCDNNCFACLQLEEENCNGDCIWIAEPGNGIEPYCRNNLLFEEDGCGLCVGGTTGNEECVQDCSGAWGGETTLDACGV